MTRCDQPLQQANAQTPLADERMGEERLARGLEVACDRRLCCQALVGGYVLGEAEELRREWGLGERDGTLALHPRRYFHSVVVGEAGERSSITEVDDMRLAGAGGEEAARPVAASL